MSRRKPGLHTESFGSGPDLVMVHGWAMHSGVWRDFAERLADRVRVTLIDLPGHGLSGEIEDFSLDSVSAALAEAAPDHAYWLGWSLGALFASAVAARWPERVRGVVLMAGSPRFVAAPDWPGVAPDLLAQVAGNLEVNFEGTLKRFIALQSFGLDDAREAVRAIELRLSDCDPPLPAALQGGLRVLQQADLRDGLRRSGIPALALLGARDRLVPREICPALQVLAPTFETRILEGAAHLPFATHPETAASLILGFINRTLHTASLTKAR